MTAIDVLIRARAKIASEFNWTQGSQARDKNDRPCEPTSIIAKRWSIDGAIVAVADHDVCLICEAKVMLAAHFRGILIFFNDSKSHGQVIDLIDRCLMAQKGLADEQR
jgi:hypothetical protein